MWGAWNGQAGVDDSGTCRKWSNRTIWETLPEGVRPQLDATTGMPVAGADVRVPPPWRLELDTDTPPLGHLELDGLLLFTRGRDVELSVETLKMTVGAIQAGTPTRPHDGKVREHPRQPRPTASLLRLPHAPTSACKPINGLHQTLLCRDDDSWRTARKEHSTRSTQHDCHGGWVQGWRMCR